MKIEDKRNDNKRKCAGIGDMITTDKGSRYIVLDHSFVCRGCTGLYDLKNNSIINTNRTTPYAIGSEAFFNSGIIMEIIPKEKLKLVIE